MKVASLLSITLLSSFSLAEPTPEYIQTNSIPFEHSSFPESLLDRLEKYKVLAIGEHHGTKQIPDVVAGLVTALSKRNKILLALEIEKANQKGLDRYLSTGDESILRILAHFAREYQDGRSSKAMVDLLRKVRNNNRVKVFAFDPDFSMDGQDRDTKMARNIISESGRDNRQIVILAGNIHSATKVGIFFDPNYRPMAYELFNLNESPFRQSDVLSIATRYESASIWACTNDKPEDCGKMKLKIPPSSYISSVNYSSYFLMEPNMTPSGYLATFFIRHAEASPPFE